MTSVTLKDIKSTHRSQLYFYTLNISEKNYLIHDRIEAIKYILKKLTEGVKVLNNKDGKILMKEIEKSKQEIEIHSVFTDWEC